MTEIIYPENKKEAKENINRILSAAKLNQNGPAVMTRMNIFAGMQSCSLFVLFKNKYQREAFRNRVDSTFSVLQDLEEALKVQYPGGNWHLGLTSFFQCYPERCDDWKEGDPFVDLRHHRYVDSDGWEL